MRTKFFGLDPGANLGYATNNNGQLEYNTVDFSLDKNATNGLRWLKYERWLEATVVQVKGEKLVVTYEEQNNYDRSHASSGELAKVFIAILLKHCEEREIACGPLHNQTLKAFAVPKGAKGTVLDRSKAVMMKLAMERLVREESIKLKTAMALTEHEADALWLYWWTKDQYGGV